MIVLGALFSIVLDVLQHTPIFGFAVAIFASGYFGSFYLDIVSTTMGERDEVPDWPSFSNFLDDIIFPFFRLCGLVLVSFWPLAVLIFADEDASWFVPAQIGAVALGCIYFPMAVLAVQAFGGITAALPHIVLPAVFRALPGYLLAIVALVVAFGVCGFAEEVAAKLPYIGWLVAAGVALYSLMFQARLIGLIYRDKRDKLGWE